MIRGSALALLGLACLVIGPTAGWSQERGKRTGPVQWIWFNEGDPLQSAPAGTRYFRKQFKINRPFAKPVQEAELDITADNAFTVWINGQKAGDGNDWHRVYRFDVQPQLRDGVNVIAVEARNEGGPAGLLVRLGYVPNGEDKRAIVSDGSWKASKTAPAGWEEVRFDDNPWPSAKALGEYGQVGAWQHLAWDAGGDDRFAVPPGFHVEMVARNPDPKDPFSLINLTFDKKGRLLVSKENGGVLLCKQPDKKGVFQSVKTYCSQVRYCQGMCWVDDALLVVGNGPQGPGLYRVRDRDGDDKTDEVKLLHHFRGSMGEHGPHAIVQGPDGWLYFIIGNHSWATPGKLAENSPLRRWPNGQMGPDQGSPKTTEDYLLPRLNDSNGHAANILAPGGTIWRLDRDGQNLSLVVAGFRNAYDLAFSPDAELFTFDSDMEWDEALPWYRAVRVCHCPPGADFVWRTGAANTPAYYVDSLPPILETGRGSPVGLEFYDHDRFPKAYRGAYFLGDWSLGLIWAVHLQRDGATYKGRAEKFCQGAPMNVTDLVVGPDGALYFTMGGRGSQGGVYRIVVDAPKTTPKPEGDLLQRLLAQPQPLAAWSRAELRKLWKDASEADRKTVADRASGAVSDKPMPVEQQIKLLTILHNLGWSPRAADLAHLAKDFRAPLRAHALWLLGIDAPPGGRPILLDGLKDEDGFVRRRACEALIRARIEPPVDALWPLLRDDDRFIRTAARLVLQRIDPGKWADRLGKESSDRAAWEAILALCKTDQAASRAELIFGRLQEADTAVSAQALLDYLRTLEMALVHTKERPASVRALAGRCSELFPCPDWRANRELAILLTEFRRKHFLDLPIHATLLQALLDDTADRQQRIHYFYCLRLLHDGWTPEQKHALLAWYDTTKTWTGGYSFTGFLENILRDLAPIFTAEDRNRILTEGDRLPWTATALLLMATHDAQPPVSLLADLYGRLARSPGAPRVQDLQEAIITAMGQSNTPQAAAALRQIEDHDPAQRDAVTRALAHFPRPDNWPYLVRGLVSTQALVLSDDIEALEKIKTQPKADDPAPFRALLLASRQLDTHSRWKVVKLLRHWTSDKRFGAEDGDWKTELAAWSRWFAQTFPKEPGLPDVAGDRPQESKYKYADLLVFLEKDPAGQHGDPARGRLVFDKAQCIKCHKFGKEGEGIGPDLSTVSKRFKRADILESIIYPSKVISDQYRSTTIITKKGQPINGLAAPQGDRITVLQSDGTKITLRKDEIEQQFASLVSVMPERLLDPLNRQEIADLFAFLESEPK
jgi:putative membrane-bound dehydrogenase-like protein